MPARNDRVLWVANSANGCALIRTIYTDWSMAQFIFAGEVAAVCIMFTHWYVTQSWTSMQCVLCIGWNLSNWNNPSVHKCYFRWQTRDVPVHEGTLHCVLMHFSHLLNVMWWQYTQSKLLKTGIQWHLKCLYIRVETVEVWDSDPRWRDWAPRCSFSQDRCWCIPLL